MTTPGTLPAETSASIGESERSEAVAAGSEGWSPEICWSLGFLTLIAAFNYLDRSLLGLVLPLVKEDLALSDTALGLISGLAFAIFYSLLGIPIGSLADRSNRRNIVAVGFGFWSLMTAITGWAANAWQLAACRFLMGAGEAAGLAPSQAIIADKVSKAKRPFALSIFTTASALDSLILLPIAGWLADRYGWRTAFHVAGVVGMVLALVFVFTVREPPRRAATAGGETRVSMWTAIRVLVRLPAYRWMLAGVSFLGGALYAAGTWTTTMLVRVQGLSVTEVAAVVTPLRGIVGAIGIVLIGWLADRLGRRDERWRLWVPALTCIACVPGYLAFLLGDSPAIWIAGLALISALHSAYQGPTFAAVIAMAPAHMRAIAVAIVVMFTGLVGQIFGPLLVGMLNDALFARYGDDAIRYSLLVVPTCILTGGLCLLMASARSSAARAE